MKIPRKQWKYWCTSDSIFWRDFKEKPPAVKEQYLYAYVVKKAKTDTTHCGGLCPAGAVAPSFTCWPTARLFSGRDPHNSSWTICILTLSSNLRKFKNWEIFVYTGSYFIHTGSELFDAIDCTKDSFSLDPKYSYQILFCSYRILFLFIPDPNLLN